MLAGTGPLNTGSERKMEEHLQTSEGKGRNSRASQQATGGHPDGRVKCREVQESRERIIQTPSLRRVPRKDHLSNK